jgi:intracellular sulfur oxidation DsrE/DsrF family protein
MRKVLLILAALLVLVIGFPAPGFAQAPHKLVLQISDNDAEKMNSVLNVAVNVSQYFSEKAEDVEIQVVAFNAGVHMLRADTSPVKDRLKSFAQSMPNVKFVACENTLDSMTRSEGKRPPLADNVALVTAGVATLIELSESGWTIVRP